MQKIVSSAIIGTAQQHNAETGTPVDTLAQQLPKGNTERNFLLTAGAWGVYKQAGLLALDAPKLPDPALPETLKACSKQTTLLLEVILQHTENSITLEALEKVYQKQLCIPIEILPQVLDYGSKHKAVRPLLLKVIGQRGQWLSQFNKQWNWVQKEQQEAHKELPNDADIIWQEGSLDQRLEVLSSLRHNDPTRARSLIEQSWKKEKVGNRVEFLKVLAINLTSEDEQILENALNDRSSQVREVAAQVLAQLPTSAFQQRMIERAERILSVKKTPDTQPQLIVTRLTQVDPDWKRDALPEKTASQPKESTGIGLQAILAYVPVNHWCNLFDMTPKQLITALKKHDYEFEILQGWSKAAILHRDLNWIPQLVKFWHKHQNTHHYYHGEDSIEQQLLNLLPSQEAEQILQNILDKDIKHYSVLENLKQPWSEQFCSFLLDKARKELRNHSQNAYSWYYALPQIALHIPPSYLDQAAQDWDVSQEGEEQSTSVHYYWSQALDKFTKIIKQRKQIQEEIN